uniref:Uncharacterized protein n=1 Tax=Panagrolaimus sp. ES5 TaxID=591445 RepID=A0AC34FYC2_9BILA
RYQAELGWSIHGNQTVLYYQTLSGEIVPLAIKNGKAYCLSCENVKRRGVKPRDFNDAYELFEDPTIGHRKKCKLISLEKKIKQQFERHIFKVIKGRAAEFTTKAELLEFYLKETQAVDIRFTDEQKDNLRKNLWRMIQPPEDISPPNTRSEKTELLPGSFTQPQRNPKQLSTNTAPISSHGARIFSSDTGSPTNSNQSRIPRSSAISAPNCIPPTLFRLSQQVVAEHSLQSSGCHQNSLMVNWFTKHHAQCFVGQSHENNKVIHWRFPLMLSQSLPDIPKGEDCTCTLNTIAMADILFRKGTHLPLWNGKMLVDIDGQRFPKKQQLFGGKENILPYSIFEAVVDALLRGREAFMNHPGKSVAEKQKDIGNPNPKSLELLKTGLIGSRPVQASDKTKKQAVNFFYGRLKSITECDELKQWPQILLYCGCDVQAFLVAYERETEAIMVFDGHPHDVRNNAYKNGAFVSCSKKEFLPEFCEFVINEYFPHLKHLAPEEEIFEMSFLYWKKSECLKDCDTPMDLHWKENTEALEKKMPFEKALFLKKSNLEADETGMRFKKKS